MRYENVFTFKKSRTKEKASSKGAMNNFLHSPNKRIKHLRKMSGGYTSVSSLAWNVPGV